jgi:hypothetical protein
MVCAVVCCDAVVAELISSQVERFHQLEHRAVIPAQAGIQETPDTRWMPAFAGMTRGCSQNRSIWVPLTRMNR